MLKHFRFRFVQAPHSRDRLKTTREMLMLVFSYHQVMPEFLDFLFPFGKQHYAQDFHFSGFRQQTRLNKRNKGLSIPELGWSGSDLRICYNLKSVEPSESHPDWPWSVRQAAVHHLFDVGSGRSSWIVVKGDDLLKRRIESATGPRGLQEMSSFKEVDRAFASSLATHLVLCDWANEHWRWYINFLEERFQATTRRTLSINVKDNLIPVDEASPSPSTQRTLVTIPVSEKMPLHPNEIFKPASESLPAMPPVMPPDFDASQTPAASHMMGSHQELSFSDMQRIQFIEEKANEALLILKANVTILTLLRGYYNSVTSSNDWPQDLQSKCSDDLLLFRQRVSNIESDFQMQESRTEAFLRLLADRKRLVILGSSHSAQVTANETQLYGIFQYQSMESSKILASKAQESAVNMEEITKDMHVIAQKTKQETISMRIITFVTLFFLPGTFISVSLHDLRERSAARP